MRITIKKDGTYNNQFNKAVACKAGDELETKEWYAQALIADGLAELASAQKAEIEYAEPPAELVGILTDKEWQGLVDGNLGSLDKIRAASDSDLRGSGLGVRKIGAVKKAIKLDESDQSESSEESAEEVSET